MFMDPEYLKELLEAPMPWIGMYIAAASAACSLAMAADAFNGFRRKKFWFPCKYFSINAFSLTVLAVAMKLPLDLTGETVGVNDLLARISSLVLMSTAMVNFMTSLGSMENNEILLNIAALGILVITIAGNVLIHNCQMLRIIFYLNLEVTIAEEFVSIFAMLLMLLTLCSLAIMVPSAKRYIESKYNEMNEKRVSNEQVEWGKFTNNELRIVVKRYWVMAATSSPQFVMARSAISGFSSLMCLLMALTLLEAHVRYRKFESFDIHRLGDYYSTKFIASNYGWSIPWILYIQSIGVVLGIISPLIRWYVAVWFKIPVAGRKSFREEFKIEDYWTSLLVEWRECSITIQIRHHKCRKLIHGAKRLVLNICIGVQMLFVLTGKLVLFISAKLGNSFFLCFHCIKNLRRPNSTAPNKNMKGLESGAGPELDLSGYVLLLEGEGELPEKIMKNICNEVDKLIKRGEKKQPKNLTRLLHKFVNFDGVREFDSNEVPSLHSGEPSNCWSLPVVTLSSIAIALPNIKTDEANQLLSGVGEGLPFLKLIERTLDRNGELGSIRNTADKVWVGVDLYKKWQDKDLRSTSIRGETHKETLQKLSDIAEKTVKDFIAERKDTLMRRTINWPTKVIAANSMYRITQTILLSEKDNKHQTDEELFERLSIMISDILAACLTNLAHVLILKCHRNTIKEREESVRQAATLLGESREIFEILQPRDLPSLDPEKAANIDAWRAFIKQGTETSPATSSNNNVCSQPNEEHLSIELQG